MPKRPTPLLPLLPSFSTAILLASMALVGCKDDGGPGTASIEFVLGNDKTCAEVGVTSIRVELSRGEGDDREVLYDEMVACSDDAPVLVEGIEPMAYDLLVQGLDSESVPIFDNLGTPAGERKLEIFEGSLAQEDVDLTARPADLLVRWDFEFTNCAGAGIERFRVRTFEVGGGNLLLEHEFDCDFTTDLAGGYRLVPDPDRVLNGTLVGEVGVVALDAASVMIGEQTTFAFDPVGPGYPVKVTVSCNDLVCSGSGTLD